MEKKWIYALLGVVVLLGAGCLLYWSPSDQVGFVDSQRLMDEYVRAAVQESLESETLRLQDELDEKIAQTAELPAEERVAAVDGLRQEYQVELDALKGDLVQPRIEAIQAAIERVADEYGVTAVIDNANQLVLYGGRDLTDAVLAEVSG